MISSGIKGSIEPLIIATRFVPKVVSGPLIILTKKWSVMAISFLQGNFVVQEVKINLPLDFTE